MPRGTMPRLTLALAFLKAASALPMALNTTAFNGTSALESPTQPGESFYSTTPVDTSTLPLESDLDATKSESHFNLTQPDQSVYSPLSSQLTSLPSESDPDVENEGSKLESRMNNPPQQPTAQDWVDWDFICEAESRDPVGQTAHHYLPSVNIIAMEYMRRNPGVSRTDADKRVRLRINALRQMFQGRILRNPAPLPGFTRPVRPQGLNVNGLVPFGAGQIIQNAPAPQNSTQAPSLQDWVDWNFITRAEARDPAGTVQGGMTPSMELMTSQYLRTNTRADRNTAIAAVRRRITALRPVFEGRPYRSSRLPGPGFQRPTPPQELAGCDLQPFENSTAQSTPFFPKLPAGSIPKAPLQLVPAPSKPQAGPSRPAPPPQAGPSQPRPAIPATQAQRIEIPERPTHEQGAWITSQVSAHGQQQGLSLVISALRRLYPGRDEEEYRRQAIAWILYASAGHYDQTSAPADDDEDLYSADKLKRRMNNQPQQPSLQDFVDWNFIEQAEAQDPPPVPGTYIRRLPSLAALTEYYMQSHPEVVSHEAETIVRNRIRTLRPIFDGRRIRLGTSSGYFRRPQLPQNFAQEVAQRGLVPFGQGRDFQPNQPRPAPAPQPGPSRPQPAPVAQPVDGASYQPFGPDLRASVTREIWDCYRSQGWNEHQATLLTIQQIRDQSRHAFGSIAQDEASIKAEVLQELRESGLSLAGVNFNQLNLNNK